MVFRYLAILFVGASVTGMAQACYCDMALHRCQSDTDCQECGLGATCKHGRCECPPPECKCTLLTAPFCANDERCLNCHGECDPISRRCTCPAEKPVDYKDCLEIYEAGFRQDGVYKIKPDNQTAIDAWCDLSNGGWTVIQRRLDGSVDFYRGWSDYVIGFGNKSGEYWLGLDNIHALTTEPTELHIYMDSLRDTTPASANYAVAIVDGPKDHYRLHWDEVTASCGVIENLECGAYFSTFDRDNDEVVSNCAEMHKTAWWYANCGSCTLNGVYDDGIKPAPCCHGGPLKVIVMKLRRTKK